MKIIVSESRGHRYVLPDLKSLLPGLGGQGLLSFPLQSALPPADDLNFLPKVSPGPAPSAEIWGQSHRVSLQSSVPWQVISIQPRASFKQGKVGGRERLPGEA